MGDAGNRAGQHRNAGHRIDPGSFRPMESSGPTLVRAAGIGARPVTNRSRGPQRLSGASGSPGSPPLAEGVSNYDQLVGDYTNPILRGRRRS